MTVRLLSPVDRLFRTRRVVFVTVVMMAVMMATVDHCGFFSIGAYDLVQMRMRMMPTTTEHCMRG